IIAGVGSFVGVVANAVEIMIDSRDRRLRRTKLNMIIGSFFSECGTPLLRVLIASDPAIGEIRDRLASPDRWTPDEFSRLSQMLGKHRYQVGISRVDLADLRAYLAGRRMFLLQLLDNPMIFEHDEFTELLQALFHVTEELMHRDSLVGLPDTDLAHLANDLARSYGYLVREWVDYMRHLKEHYPYLFSLAMRTNPFDPDASPIVR
ncbi:MAG: two pore domain potassium channel family protein, partial [Methanoregulaceae archaeon]|nr:two pore domain potassium channel family protein [Methanoregulaceae archaeon]